MDLHTSAASEINAWVDYVLMEYFIFISWCVCVCVRALACTNVRYMYVSYIAGLKKMPIRICNRKKYSSNLCSSLNKPRHCVCLSLKYFFTHQMLVYASAPLYTLLSIYWNPSCLSKFFNARQLPLPNLPLSMSAPWHLHNVAKLCPIVLSSYCSNTTRCQEKTGAYPQLMHTPLEEITAQTGDPIKWDQWTNGTDILNISLVPHQSFC